MYGVRSVSIPSNRGVLPETVWTLQPTSSVFSVSIPSNRGVLPELCRMYRLSRPLASLNPLKSGRPSGAYTFGISLVGVDEGLNPLKSGRPSGEFGVAVTDKAFASQSPQIGASFRSVYFPCCYVSVIPCLNPLKSGRPSGADRERQVQCCYRSVSIPSNRGVLPELHRVQCGSIQGTVSIPSNRGVLPEVEAWRVKDATAPKSQSPQIGASFRSQGRSEQNWTAGNVSIPSNRGVLPEIMAVSCPINSYAVSQSPQIGASFRSSPGGLCTVGPRMSQSPQIGASFRRCHNRCIREAAMSQSPQIGASFRRSRP